MLGPSTEGDLQSHQYSTHLLIIVITLYKPVIVGAELSSTPGDLGLQASN